MNKKIILIIFIIFGIFIPKKCMAAGIVRLNDINNPPVINNRETIFIYNFNSSTCKPENVSTNNSSIIYKRIINKNKYEMYIILDKMNNYSIGNNKYLFKNSDGSPLFTVNCVKAGYYVNENGEKKDVDVKISYNEVELYAPVYNRNSNQKYYNVATISASAFNAEANLSDKNFASAGNFGVHQKVTFEIVNTGTNSLDSEISNKMMIPWKMRDIDVRDNLCSEPGIIRYLEQSEYQVINDLNNKNIKTKYEPGYGKSCTYREAIKYNESDFYRDFYIKNDSFLDISNNNTKFSATNGTNNTDYPFSEDYSTVIAYQIKPKATIEWWGSGCGTNIRLTNDTASYPFYVPPKLKISNIKSGNNTKNVNTSKAKVKTGDTITYVMTQDFPYVVNKNAAKSITISTTFDNALDISKINLKVAGKINNKWKLDKNGQKVTIKYTGKDTEKIIGVYTFTLSNIKVKKPDNKHAVIKENSINLTN